MDWESFYKWLSGKLAFQLFTVATVGGLMVLAYFMKSRSSTVTTSASTSRFIGRFPTAPEKCYCSVCGAEIDMKKYGLYGKHCKEVKACPVCGADNYPLWRTPR